MTTVACHQYETNRFIAPAQIIEIKKTPPKEGRCLALGKLKLLC